MSWDDPVMPPGLRRPPSRARLGRTALVILVVGLLAGSAPPAMHLAPTGAVLSLGALDTADALRAEAATTRMANQARDVGATEHGATSIMPSEPPSFIYAARGPAAIVDPLAVEGGELTVHWREIDGLGPAITERTLRVEQAPATPTGCADFTVAGGYALGGETPDRGTISLGQPPADGCLRVSLAVTDGLGRTSVASSAPFRVQPPAPVVEARAAAPAWSGKFNLFRANSFVTQKTFKWCVAASVQMMVNLVRDRSDRTRATQARMIAYAQRWDNGPYGEEGGTDVTGWIAALRHYGAGRYRAVGTTTPARALRIAATAMRQTGRPAGILVMDGRHAWVLHGFESRTDPRRNRRANITAVRVSGPLYPVQQKNGYDQRPNTRLTARQLERYFKPTEVGTMVGRYVVVIPTH